MVGVLAVLPRGVRILELATHCAGPVLEVLQRFRQLQRLRITDSGAGITWGCRGAARVLPKLVQLRLDGRQRPQWCDDGSVHRAEVDTVPSDALIALAAATRLHSLALCLRWDDGVPALCFALPALLELR